MVQVEEMAFMATKFIVHYLLNGHIFVVCWIHFGKVGEGVSNWRLSVYNEVLVSAIVVKHSLTPFIAGKPHAPFPL